MIRGVNKMRKLRVTHDDIQSVYKGFKQNRDERLVIGIQLNKQKTDFRLVLVPSNNLSSFSGSILLDMTIEDLFKAVGRYKFRSEFRGYKPNAKHNKDWYASDDRLFCMVLHDILNKRVSELINNESNNQVQSRVEDLAQLRDEVYNRVERYIKGDYDLPYYSATNVASHVINCCAIRRVSTPVDNSWVSPLVLFLSDELGGSQADYLLSAFLKGVAGYELSLLGNDTTTLVLWSVSDNIRSYALYPEEVFGELNKIIKKFGIDFKLDAYM